MHQGESDASRQHRIVVGVSGSLGSIAALHHAVAQARRTGAEVLAVLAWDPLGAEYAYRRPPRPPLLAARREEAVARLREAVAGALGAGVPGVRLHGQVSRGRAGEVLVHAAGRADDLLVVGAGSGGPLRRALRRSATRHCVRHAGCPVLVVPKPELQREWEAFGRHRAWQLPTEPAPTR